MRKNVIGEQYGYLTIIDDAENYVSPKGKIVPQVKCKCVCGKEFTCVVYDITRGHTTSCGCRGCTTYFDISGDVGIGRTANDGTIFYFDIEDYDKISQYLWMHKNNGYIYNAKVKQLHRLIMNCPDNMVVDHIDGNPLNNCKSNLRICTQQQNNQNSRVRNCNKLHCKGVHKTQNGYIAQIAYNGEKIYLGCFATIKEAKAVYEAAAIKYFGEFANTGG